MEGERLENKGLFCCSWCMAELGKMAGSLYNVTKLGTFLVNVGFSCGDVICDQGSEAGWGVGGWVVGLDLLCLDDVDVIIYIVEASVSGMLVRPAPRPSPFSPPHALGGGGFYTASIARCQEREPNF